MTTGYVSGSISLGRETTCLAESYHVGGYWIDEVDEVDDGTKHSIHEEKRRIVGSPKAGDPWPSYSPVPSPVRPLSSPTASRDALHVLTSCSHACCGHHIAWSSTDRQKGTRATSLCLSEGKQEETRKIGCPTKGQSGLQSNTPRRQAAYNRPEPPPPSPLCSSPAPPNTPTTTSQHLTQANTLWPLDLGRQTPGGHPPGGCMCENPCWE